jgi:type IV secretion system protein VirD4
VNERFLLGLLGTVITLLLGLHLARHQAPPLWTRLATALSGLLSAWLLKNARDTALPYDTHGSARFLTPCEDKTLLRSPERRLPPGSVVLGCEREHLVVLTPIEARQHGLIVGGSGTGKSFSFFLPNAALARGTSCVFIDPKSELWRYTSGYHASSRYAPAEPEASTAFNWIPLCADPRLAELAARAIVESGNAGHTEQAWLDLEAAFLSAIFAHASTLPYPTPLTAYRLFTRQTQEALVAELRASASATAREQAEVFAQTTERMRGSIVPVVAARLQFLRDPNVARFTSAVRDSPDFGLLKEAPAAVYWCLREQDIARLRPLTSLFFTLLLEQLAAAEGTVPVLLFLDEFATAGSLPHFETTIALARGRGVGIWLGLQSLAQLDARYGAVNARTILTNCATKIALSGLDVETAEYFSRALGQTTVLTQRSSRTRRWMTLFPSAVQEGALDHGRSLLTPDEVRRLPDGKALVLTGNRLPLAVSRYRYARLPLTGHVEPLGEALAEENSAPAARRRRPAPRTRAPKT